MLNNTPDTKYKADLGMGDNISMMVSQFPVLAVMGSNENESMKKAPFNSPTNNRSKYEPMIASIDTLGQETTTLDYVLSIVVEEFKRLRKKFSSRNVDTFNNSGELAFNARGKFHTSASNRRSPSNSIQCYARGKIGHDARSSDSRNQLWQMNSKYLTVRTFVLENDAFKNIGRKGGAVMSHPRSVRINYSVDTCAVIVIVHSGALKHMAHDISLLKDMHDGEPISVFLPDRSEVAAK